MKSKIDEQAARISHLEAELERANAEIDRLETRCVAYNIGLNGPTQEPLKQAESSALRMKEALERKDAALRLCASSVKCCPNCGHERGERGECLAANPEAATKPKCPRCKGAGVIEDYSGDKDDFEVCGCHTEPGDAPSSPSAPDLLKSAKAVLRSHDIGCEGAKCNISGIDDLRAAIKAKEAAPGGKELSAE